VPEGSGHTREQDMSEDNNLFENREQFRVGGIWFNESTATPVTDEALCRMILALRDTGKFSQLDVLILVTLTVTHGEDSISTSQAGELISQALQLEQDGVIDPSTTPSAPPGLVDAAKSLVDEVENGLSDILGQALASIGGVPLQSPTPSEEELEQLSSMAVLAAAQVPVSLRD